MTDTRDLPPGAEVAAGDIVEAAGHPVGGGVDQARTTTPD